MKKDLASLLIEDSTKGVGFFDNVNWHVHFGKDTDDLESQLISLHESLHSDLNNSTVYGLILQMHTYLFRETKERYFQEILFYLIDQCRNAHETFATYLGVSILLPADSKKEQQQKLLYGYPKYHTYYNQAANLVNGLNGKFWKENGLRTIIRTVMQGNTLVDQILKNPKQIQIAQIDNLDLPDIRLTYLKKVINANFWRGLSNRFYTIHSNKNYTNLLKASEQDACIHKILIKDNYQSDYEALLLFIYEAITNLFQEQNYLTLDFNQHLDYVEVILSTANEIFPFHKAANPLVKNPSPTDYNQTTTANFKNEILYISEAPIKARLYNFKAVSPNNWHQLVVGIGKDQHLFIIARSATNLIKQYQFSEAEQAMLEKLSTSPLVFLRRGSTINQQQRIVELFFIEKPESIIDLAQKTQLSILFNASMIALADNNWNALWTPIMQSHTFPTILFNLSPYVQLGRIKDQFDVIEYHDAIIEIDGKKHAFFLFCAWQKTFPWLFLTPCSIMTAKSIQYHIRENIKSPLFIKNNKCSAPYNWQISMTIGHLFREEYFFDFWESPEGIE